MRPDVGFSQRLARDGWKLTSYPDNTKDELEANSILEFDSPIQWQKPHPLWPAKYTLQMSILGLGEQKGPWTISEHAILCDHGAVEAIGRSEWADWSSNGDALFSQSGRLYRLRCVDGTLGSIETSQELADFSGLRFHACETPEEAKQWPVRKAKRLRN
jgi:hypothetical protein